jgi:hypothetical protein
MKRRRRQGEQAVMSGQLLFARYSLHATLVWKDEVDDGAPVGEEQELGQSKPG